MGANKQTNSAIVEACETVLHSLSLYSNQFELTPISLSLYPNQQNSPRLKSEIMIMASIILLFGCNGYQSAACIGMYEKLQAQQAVLYIWTNRYRQECQKTVTLS